MAERVPEYFSIPCQDKEVRKKITAQVTGLIRSQTSWRQRSLVFLCIGSERYIGDALGPLTGTYLEEHTSAKVIGTLEQPVHAGNLCETLQRLQANYQHPLVVAIDACLGKPADIGSIEVRSGGLVAGSAVGAGLPAAGDISILGIVNKLSSSGYLELQYTPLSRVVKLSQYIGGALRDTLAGMLPAGCRR